MADDELNRILNAGDDTDQKTKFDIQLATLYEIRRLLTQCNEFSIEATRETLEPTYLKLWLNTIKCIHREIAMLLSDKDNQNIDQTIKNINKLPPVSKLAKCSDGTYMTKIDSNAFFQTWNALDQLDRLVRLNAHSKGMLITFKGSVFD